MEKEIIKKIISDNVETPNGLEKVKRFVMAQYKNLSPTNIRLLQVYHEMNAKEKSALFVSAGKKFSKKKDEAIKKLLITRPVRSLSGIVNVSVLMKPYPCPGKCIYCPEEKGMPKSYLENEPAVMRAVMNKYDPKKQIKTRIDALKMSGHPVDKIELRIIGGTWSFYPPKYQTDFIKDCIDACNEKKGKDLKASQKKNESSKQRIVGISIETRPDFIDSQEIIKMRNLGITSVELGVQSVYDDILKKIKRGHKISATIQATKKLKDAGFKVCYQMMPNLPGATIKRDIQTFHDLFANPDFRPDYLKIYPMATIKGTAVYKLWLQKKYKPYSDTQLIKLLKEIKKQIPRYVRIQRLIRDIPAPNIEAGTKISNLRQIISKESLKENWSCQCIRCREIKAGYQPNEKLKMFRENYRASDGKEIFLSFENEKRDKLFSVLRLRIPCNPSINVLKNSAIIREIHTYGRQLAIAQKGISPQHKGLGKKLVKKAENIAKKEFNCKKIAVISAIGTRNYYRKSGYRLEESYMTKKL